MTRRSWGRLHRLRGKVSAGASRSGIDPLPGPVEIAGVALIFALQHAARTAKLAVIASEGEDDPWLESPARKASVVIDRVDEALRSDAATGTSRRIAEIYDLMTRPIDKHKEVPSGD